VPVGFLPTMIVSPTWMCCSRDAMIGLRVNGKPLLRAYSLISAQLRYYPTVTRQAYRNRGRVTELIETGKLFEDIDLPRLSSIHEPGSRKGK